MIILKILAFLLIALALLLCIAMICMKLNAKISRHLITIGVAGQFTSLWWSEIYVQSPWILYLSFVLITIGTTAIAQNIPRTSNSRLSRNLIGFGLTGQFISLSWWSISSQMLPGFPPACIMHTGIACQLARGTAILTKYMLTGEDYFYQPWPLYVSFALIIAGNIVNFRDTPILINNT